MYNAPRNPAADTPANLWFRTLLLKFSGSRDFCSRITHNLENKEGNSIFCANTDCTPTATPQK